MATGACGSSRPSSWWQRIRVKGKKSGALEFEAVTQTARAPARLLPTQRGLVDGFVAARLETTANDPKLGHTLFELLVPNDFKPYAPDRRKLALMLNPAAAAHSLGADARRLRSGRRAAWRWRAA